MFVVQICLRTTKMLVSILTCLMVANPFVVSSPLRIHLYHTNHPDIVNLRGVREYGGGMSGLHEETDNVYGMMLVVGKNPSIMVFVVMHLTSSFIWIEPNICDKYRSKCSGLFDFECHLQYVCMSWVVMFGLFLSIFPTVLVLLWLLHQKGLFDPLYDWWDDHFLDDNNQRHKHTMKPGLDIDRHHHHRHNHHNKHHGHHHRHHHRLDDYNQYLHHVHKEKHKHGPRHRNAGAICLEKEKDDDAIIRHHHHRHKNKERQAIKRTTKIRRLERGDGHEFGDRLLDERDHHKQQVRRKE